MNPTRAQSRISIGADRIILTLIFGAALVFYSSIQLHHDVAWYAYCNLRQLEGMRPYVEMVEVSPPIVFYLTLAPVALAKAAGLSLKFCIAAYVLSLTAISLGMALSFDGQASARERRWKMVAGAIVFTVLPIAVFAQREHFAVLLSLPYFYAAGARLRNARVPKTLALIAGLMAGVGLSIKPHFLLAPLVVELALLIVKRSPRTLLRMEILAAIAAGLLHTAFVLLVHPEYFSVSVPLVFATYDAYSLPPRILAMQPWCLAATFGIAFWLIGRRYVRNVPTADCLFLGAVAFYAVFFWQAKGWGYHALPANLILCLSSIEMFAAVQSGRASAGALSRRLRWLVPAAPVAVVMTQAIASGPYRNQLALDAAPYIERHAPRGSVFVMSSKISAAFPMVLDAGAKWASRFSTKWMLPAIIRSQQPDSGFDADRKAALTRLAAWEIDATTADFEKFRPEIVFVDCAFRDTATMIYGQPIDMIEYYRRDPRFREIWAQYAMKEVLSSSLFGRPQKLEVWVRANPGGTPAAASASHPAASHGAGTHPAREAAGPPQDSRTHASREQEMPHGEKR